MNKMIESERFSHNAKGDGTFWRFTRLKQSRRVPEDRAAAQEFDRLLKRNKTEILDYTCAFHERWARRNVTTMRGTGWALRPLMIPAARLDFVAASIHGSLTSLRAFLRQNSGQRGRISRSLPFHKNFEDCVDVGAGAASAAFLAYCRPDGFLFEDRYVLSEINYGNGIMVSCGYTEATADYWARHPVLKRLGWDLNRLHRRPLPWLIQIARRFARPVARPKVALFAHSAEWFTLRCFPIRVLNQIHFVCSQFERAFLDPRLVTEQDLALDRRGQLRFSADGERVDLLMFITVGPTFLDEPERMMGRGELRHYGKARIGDTWVLKPLAGLVVDKGALPLLDRISGPYRMPDGFEFQISPTEFPFRKDPARYLDARKTWVTKRSFDGKDTHIGYTSSPADWENAVKTATRSHEYVAQRYVSLPRAEIPVFVDERYLEWVPSRVELSTFIYDGAFAGAGVRHAPDAEGHIMTDFPEGYGYSTAFAV